MDSILTERLFFVRYLYTIAENQTRLSRPRSYASVLTLHDSVELFLQFIAEEVEADVKKDIKFMEYWPKINEKLKDRNEALGYQEAMTRLNGSRVNLKHHAIPVAEESITEYRLIALDFFREYFIKIFGVNFEDISLVDAVQNQNIREMLKKAEKLIEEGDLKSTLSMAAVAFDKLLKDFEAKEKDRWGRSPYAFGAKFEFRSSDIHALENIGAKKFADDVCRTLQQSKKD